MFLIPFFLLLFNVQLKAADEFNERMGITFDDVVTVRDLVDLLDQTAPNMVPSWKATAALLGGSALLYAYSMNQFGSCPPSFSDLNDDNVYSCCSELFARGLPVAGVVLTGLFKSGAMEKIYNWIDGKKISWGRFLDEAANDNDIRQVGYLLMRAQSPLLKKLKPDQMLLLIPHLDEFKKCTEKKCFSQTSMVLASRFIRMLEMTKKELRDELWDEKVQKEIAESCNKKRFYYLLRFRLPEDKRSAKLTELISK